MTKEQLDFLFANAEFDDDGNDGAPPLPVVMPIPVVVPKRRQAVVRSPENKNFWPQQDTWPYLVPKQAPTTEWEYF